MQYNLLDKIKAFCLFNKKIVITIFCLLFGVIISSIYFIGYSERLENEENEFDEIQAFIDELKEKDSGLYNQVEVEKIEKIAKGIDVSSWQGDINWEKVASSEIDFVMIRCGYRNLSNDEIHVDDNFVDNIEQANYYDIPVGIYFYSTAINEKEVLEEASFVLNLIKDYKITYPVAYDFEMFNEKRTKGVKDSKINSNALRFLDYMREHGYNGMLYSNYTALSKHWNLSNFDSYDLWLAQYADEFSFDGDIGMWQYSDRGRVDGIKGYVDLNESYFVYEEV